MNNKCDQCEALMINGVYCHELGCPNRRRRHTYICTACGALHDCEDDANECCDDLQSEGDDE